MKYKFIENNKYSFTIKGMCHALLVNPSAYYAWKKRGSSKRTMQDDLILKEIKQVYTDSREQCYGSPRMTTELLERGISSGVKKVARLMRANNLKAKIRRKHSYKKSKNTTEYISENIFNRNFTQDKPDKAWVSDITYIHTKNGWAYLCVFIDLFSKAVVGWSVSESANTKLVIDAFNKAYLLRNPG